MPSQTKNRIHVLLVEDNPPDAKLVKIALSEPSNFENFSVIHAATMTQALQVLDAEMPDVILLDLSLPDSFGISTLETIQARAPKTPVVVMTGLDDPEVANAMLESGAQDYLVKGEFDPHLVKRSIRYAVTRMNILQENRRLVEQLAANGKRLEEELKGAQETQIALMPKEDKISRIRNRYNVELNAHFETSSELGGDFWGLTEIDDERFGIFLVDFSGHGVIAALNTFRLHTLINDHGFDGQDPALWLEKLGNTLYSLLPVGQYATMFAGIIDIQAENITYAAAASPRPLLWEGGRLSFLDTQGMLLGAVAKASYVSHKTNFPKGASLFLYSDALTESIDDNGWALGEEGVRMLSRAAMGLKRDSYLNFVLGHFFNRFRRPLADDLTAIWLTRH